MSNMRPRHKKRKGRSMTAAVRNKPDVFEEQTPGPFAHKETLRLDFSKRLLKAMAKKGWTQSDLARAAAVHSSDKKFGRDLVSGYVRAKYTPHPLHLDALVKALGVSREDLLPAGNLPHRGETIPPQDLRSLGDGRASLRINQVMPMELALKIMQLINSQK